MNDVDETIETDTKVLLAKALAALPAKTTLRYIDRDEAFSDENCAAIVGGEKDDVFEKGWDFSEGEACAVDMYLKDALPDDEERELFEDSEEFETFREACYDRDDSDAYQDVLRNTGRRLVRFYIRTPQGERIAMEESCHWGQARVEEEARRIAAATKLPYFANWKQLNELVSNATYGGVLCVIAYVEMQDVDKWVEHCLKGDERGRVALTFTNPHLLLHDAWNGSGHDVTVDGQITIRFGRGALHQSYGVMALDAKNAGTGYSWDETCSLYRPAYKADPQVRLYQAMKHQKPDRQAPEAWPGR